MKKSQKLRFYGQVEAYGAQRETVILVCKSLFQIRILFAPPMLLLVHRSILFKIIYLLIFTDEKSDVVILLIICFLQFFFSSRFRLVFLPTTLASHPPGVMLLNHSTAPRDNATDIEKTSQKGTLERAEPNRSVVKKVGQLVKEILIKKISIKYLNL